MFATLSKICDNKDGCADHYICDTTLYLMPMLSQAISIIIHRGITALPGEEIYDTYMVIHTVTRTYDVSLAIKCQKHLSNASYKHGVIDKIKFKKRANKKVEIKVIL